MEEKGYCVRLITERHNKLEKCYKAHNKAPVLVKPCPGEKRSEQGF